MPKELAKQYAPQGTEDRIYLGKTNSNEVIKLSPATV